MNLNTFKQLVNEEIQSLLKEAQEKAPSYSKKLEELRKKLVPEVTDTMTEKVETDNKTDCRRVHISTVAEILDVPVNELMLYFLNNVKTSNVPNGKSLVEYHLGEVWFYSAENA